MMPFQHRKLLAQCQILEQEALTRAKEPNDGSEGDPEESKHGEDLYQNVGGEDRSDVIEVIESRGGRSFGEAQVLDGIGRPLIRLGTALSENLFVLP